MGALATVFLPTSGIVPKFTNLFLEMWLYLWYIVAEREGSHSGLVRAPAKRLEGEIPLMGSNPIPSVESGNIIGHS